MQDAPTAKRSKRDDRFVGCCTCSQKSKCSTSLCVCKKAGKVCAMRRSNCCSDKPDVSSILTNQASSSPDCRDCASVVKGRTHIDADENENASSQNQHNNNNIININDHTSTDTGAQSDSPSPSPPKASDASNYQDNDVSSSPKFNTTGDLDGYAITDMDHKLAELFDGEYVHNNDGPHLDGGIEEDKIWQDRHKNIISHPLRLHDLPSGPIGRDFIKTLSEELIGVKLRKWNMERPPCFLSCMLQISPDAKGTKNIRTRIKTRLSE